MFLRRWLRPVARLGLIAALVLIAARLGALPTFAYAGLYELVAAPGRMTGRGERTALVYFRVNCQPYRYPREVLALATLGERRLGVEKSIFTCAANR